MNLKELFTLMRKIPWNKVIERKDFFSFSNRLDNFVTVYSFPRYAWPGGYPLYYLMGDGGILCPDCVNYEEQAKIGTTDEQWRIEAWDVNWDNTSQYCDNCSEQIESAYGEDDE